MNPFVIAPAAAALALATAASAQAPIPSPPVAEDEHDVHDLRPAGVPLVASPLDMGQASDPIWAKGDRPASNVIARMTLRPVETVVVEVDVGQGADKPLVLSRALVGPTGGFVLASDMAGLGGQRLFCADGFGATADKIFCLVDADADGRFEARAAGLGESGAKAVQLAIVGPPLPLAAPVAYRAANAAETPSIEASFTNCAKDHDRPRYAFAAKDQTGAIGIDQLIAMGANARMGPEQLAQLSTMVRMMGSGAPCLTAHPAEEGDSLYPAELARGGVVARMSELVIAVGPKDDGAAVRLIGLRNPYRLYRLDGGAVVALSETVTERQNALAVRQKFDKPVLMTAAGAEVAEGERGVGDVVLTVPFAHGYMGVLTADTKIRTLFSSRSLPQGTVLYGIPMSSRSVMTINGVPRGSPFDAQPVGPGQVRLTWCVPVEEEGEWSATCIPDQGGERYTLLKGQRPAFEVTSMRYDAGTSSNDGRVPVVEQPGAFGARLAWRFRIKSLSEAEIELTQETLFGDAVVNSRPRIIQRVPGEASGLSIGRGMARFAAVDGKTDKIAVTKARDFAAGTEATIQSGIARTPIATPPVATAGTAAPSS